MGYRCAGGISLHLRQRSCSPKVFKAKSMTLYGDGVPVVGEMIKRGIIKSEDPSK